MNLQRDQRINDSHLKRDAIIYIRQSSPTQVKMNTESLNLQLALREKAISYGWNNPIVIDDDLGISAGGFADRPGFQRLLTMITMKQVGVIFCYDASRLSRNSKDWAHLFELSGFFDTLIADVDQIYNLNHPNDRMVLGIKGTISELELSILKLRMKQGSIEKARRGELKFNLPSGYIYDNNSKIVTDPDTRVRKAIYRLFSEFKKHTSVRQLALWYLENNISFPVRRIGATTTIAWEIPKYNNLRTLLLNPIYAGVYAYGRRQTFCEYRNGTLIKRISDYLPFEKWQVLIKNHHEAYISWEEFLDIHKKISQNRPRWKMDENLCAIREGLALLVGLMRCGHCGNKLYVSYKTKKRPSAMYYCRGVEKHQSPTRCLAFGAHFIDKYISTELLKALEPAGVEAGFAAVEMAESENSEKLEMARLEVENAEYQAQRAFEQYDLADPKNRLVTATLEERLNTKLLELNKAREKFSEIEQSNRNLSEDEKESILELSRNFKEVWYHEKTDPVLKKQLLRLFIQEIIVKHDADTNMLHMIIHWQGGVHTKVSVKKRKVSVGKKADVSLIEKVKKLAGRIDDAEIARVLNMSEEVTPSGLRWNKDRVTQFRRHHHIKNRKRNREDIFTSEKAVEYLGISRRALTKLVDNGLIETNQVMRFAPWEIKREDLDSENVRQAIEQLRKTGRLFPDKGCSGNQMELFPKKSDPSNTK